MPTYSESHFSEVLAAIKAGTSMRKASQQWNIPFITLHRRYHGSTTRRLANEATQRLSGEQEKHLADWVVAQAALGEPVTQPQIRDFAARILRACGDTRPLGSHWTRKFLDRNPQCTTKGSKSATPRKHRIPAPRMFRVDVHERSLSQRAKVEVVYH
ncbi:hypothetical protein VTK73DRAFT_5641 [Phialemonium thermophilum]|uniref:HTH CENPB-type domain-containing protein n=1 Tax=Phialemonium thermophilum TaxID=223376 RepID=A0ABR3WMP2_9PEZI